MGILELPGETPCPFCAAPLEKVFVDPVLSDGKLAAVEVICPNCETTHAIGVESMARTIAQRIMTGG